MSKPNIITAPAMTRQDWEDLPEAVRYFIPWEKARQPLIVKRVAPPQKATNYARLLRAAKAGRR